MIELNKVYNEPCIETLHRMDDNSIDICNDFILHGVLCPYMKTERKKYQKKVKNQTTLEL